VFLNLSNTADTITKDTGLGSPRLRNLKKMFTDFCAAVVVKCIRGLKETTFTFLLGPSDFSLRTTVLYRRKHSNIYTSRHILTARQKLTHRAILKSNIQNLIASTYYHMLTYFLADFMKSFSGNFHSLTDAIHRDGHTSLSACYEQAHSCDETMCLLQGCYKIRCYNAF